MSPPLLIIIKIKISNSLTKVGMLMYKKIIQIKIHPRVLMQTLNAKSNPNPSEVLWMEHSNYSEII
jgi:hypothetical protein